MKKRLLSLILVCSTLLPLSANAFNTEDAPIPEWIVDETVVMEGMTDKKYSHIYDLLNHLDCVEVPANEINPDEKITREEAVAMFAKINGISQTVTNESFSDVKKTDSYAGEIYSALQAGLISNDSGKFYPKKYITLDECGSIALKLLGYGKLPMLDEASYIKDLKLYKNVKDENGTLTRGNFYIFLENMLLANPVKLNITEPGYSYEFTVSEEYYITEQKNIKVYTGIVTSTGYSAIYNKKDTSEGYIEINNMKMKTKNSVSESMLGKYVNAYVDIENDENVVITLAEKEKYNEENSIEFNNFEEFSNNKLTYYIENAKKRVSISENAIFVYNGQFGGDLTKATEYFSDFDTIRTLDNNRDGKADIIFVDKKQYAYIESASESSQSMRTGMGEYLDFSEDICKSYRIFNEDGEQIVLANVLPGTVIEYKLAYSYDKKAIYEIILSKAKVVGVFKGKYTDGGKTYYNINGTQYEISDYYKRYLTEDTKNDKPQIGNEASFYLSKDGKIVFSSANVYNYGFVLKGYCDTENGDICNLTLYTYDGSKESYNLNEKIKLITPDKPEGIKVEAPTAIAKLKDDGGNIKNEMIAFQLDGEKNIKLIATEKDMTGQKPENTDYPLVKNHVINATDSTTARRVYQELIGFTWYVPSSVKRMTVPVDKSKFDDTKYFSVGSVKGQGGENNEYLLYEHILYNSDEFYNVGFCITRENKIGFSSDIIEPYLITKVATSINDSDEKGIEIEYLSKKGKNSAFIKYSTAMTTSSSSWMPECSVEDLKPGDVIQFEKDSVGDVSVLAVIIKSDDLPDRGAYGTDGVTNSYGYFNPFSSRGILHGTVEKTQVATESALINISPDGTDVNGSMIFRIGKHGVGFYDYNVYLIEGKKFSAVTFSDIMPGDEVVGIKRYNKVTDIYILR